MTPSIAVRFALSRSVAVNRANRSSIVTASKIATSGSDWATAVRTDGTIDAPCGVLTT